MSKIVFRHLNCQKELIWTEETHLAALVIENPINLRNFLIALTGEDESEPPFAFIADEKMLEVGTEVDVLLDPLRLNFNNRRAMTALLKRIVQTASSEDFYLRTGEVKSSVAKYLDDLIEAGDYGFVASVDEEFSVEGLAKLANLKIGGLGVNYVETLVNYLTMMTELVGVELFAIYGLGMLLDGEEFSRLCHDMENHQINLLLVEPWSGEKLRDIPKIVLDEDGCEL